MLTVEVKPPLDVMLPRYRDALSAPTWDESERAIVGAEALLAAEFLAAQCQSPLWRSGALSPSVQAARSMAEDQLEQIRAVYAFGLVAVQRETVGFSICYMQRPFACAYGTTFEPAKDRACSRKGLNRVIAELSDDLRAKGIRGGRDQDTLRNYWMTFRGVAHFGAGLRVAEMEGLEPSVGIEIGEEVRFSLANESAVSDN